MVCKTTEVEILPIKDYYVVLIDENWEVEPSIDTEYDIEQKPITSYELVESEQKTDVIWEISLKHDIGYNIVKEYTFRYCVSFRDPNAPEWILARWVWNDYWIWTPDWIWRDE